MKFEFDPTVRIYEDDNDFYNLVNYSHWKKLFMNKEELKEVEAALVIVKSLIDQIDDHIMSQDDD